MSSIHHENYSKETFSSFWLHKWSEKDEGKVFGTGGGLEAPSDVLFSRIFSEALGKHDEVRRQRLRKMTELSWKFNKTESFLWEFDKENSYKTAWKLHHLPTLPMICKFFFFAFLFSLQGKIWKGSFKLKNFEASFDSRYIILAYNAEVFLMA
jgi:hypothetical protein